MYYTSVKINKRKVSLELLDILLHLQKKKKSEHCCNSFKHNNHSFNKTEEGDLLIRQFLYMQTYMFVYVCILQIKSSGLY